MHARLLDTEPVPPAHLGEWKHCCDDPELDCFELHSETHLSFVLQGAIGLIDSALESFPLGVLLLYRPVPVLKVEKLILCVGAAGKWDPDFATDDDQKEIAAVKACNHDGTFTNSRIWLCGMHLLVCVMCWLTLESLGVGRLVLTVAPRQFGTGGEHSGSTLTESAVHDLLITP
jgi:hypothetical protein